MAEKSGTITDPTGRELEVRLLSGMERMRLMRMWGPAANVQIWLGNAMIASMVRSIDTIPVPLPVSVEAAERLVDKLGDDAIETIASWAQENTPSRAAVIEEAKN